MQAPGVWALFVKGCIAAAFPAMAATGVIGPNQPHWSWEIIDADGVPFQSVVLTGKAP